MFVRKSFSGFATNSKGGFTTSSSSSKGGFTSMNSVDIIEQKTTKQHVNELMKYDKMRHVILSAFNTYMTQFKTGHFDLLEERFDAEEANRLGQLLVGDKLSTFSAQEKTKFLKSKTLFSAYPDTTQNFPTYKSFIHTLIDGLNAVTTLQKQNEQLRTANDDLAVYRDTLTDIVKLKEYIDSHYLNFAVGLFATEQVMETTFTIKEEYQIYINTYGLPGPAGFNSERLAMILYDISIRGG
jgi:hypothetical protein